MKKALLAAGIVALAACSDTTSPTSSIDEGLKPMAAFLPGNNKVIVSPGNTDGWFFFNDENNTIDASLGSFVSGPGTPTYGTGSAQISVTGTQRRNLATYQFAGVPLADITTLSFRTYNPTAGNIGSATRSAYLHFNVDFSGADNWQRRLVFVPNQNGTVLQDTWQEWDAINSGDALWAYSGPTWPGTIVSGSTLKTWSQILSEYSGVRIRVSDPFLGLRVGEPYLDGYTENIDSFTFGTAAGTTVYDFEGSSTFGSCSASDDGTTITLLANCVTDRTLTVPNGKTLDGADFTVTAVEPLTGSFTGPIIAAASGSLPTHVRDLTVTASNMSSTCGTLKGIYFYGTPGSIKNNTVVSVNRGPNGCQDGSAIDARNVVDPTAPYISIEVSGNTVSSYNKNGITANGRVSVVIADNEVTGNGAVGVPLAAQNGIQVSRGATGIVRNNTVRDNNYVPASYLACGILLYQASGVKVSGSIFSGNEKDLCNFGKGGGKVTASN